MRVRYIGDGYRVVLQEGVVYEVMRVEGGLYRIFSETIDDDALFPPDLFEVVEAGPRPPEYAADDLRIAIY